MYRTEIPISCVGVHSLGICNTEKIPVSYLEVASWEYNYNGIPVSRTDVESWEQYKNVLNFPLAVKPSWLTASLPFPSLDGEVTVVHMTSWYCIATMEGDQPNLITKHHFSLMKRKFASSLLIFLGKCNAVQDSVQQNSH